MAEGLKRILYVEDEPDIREVAKLALEAVGGFSVAMCASGQEAMEKAAAFSPQFILLDVMMPGMDGPTTLLRLRQMPQLASVPVAFMTAKVQPGEVAQYLEMGAVDVIPKPFDPMTLAATVSAIWENKVPAAAKT
jgi:CheY-like chemotaxis protein